MLDFGTESRPLRPSSLGKLLKCGGQVVLSLGLDSEGNQGAQTGSLLHRAVEGFHRGGDSPAAGMEALEEAIPGFPLADTEKARRWFTTYAADATNQRAIARIPITPDMRKWKPAWEGESNDSLLGVELPVRLVYKGVWIQGTLDQIRLTDGVLTVWDLKTGSFLKPEETVSEYQAQQAAYVLAARQTTGLDIQPGGLVYVSGYDLPRGRRFIRCNVSIEQCEDLLDEVVERVERIRTFGPSFTPSADACKFCVHKPFPTCAGIQSDSSSPRSQGTRSLQTVPAA